MKQNGKSSLVWDQNTHENLGHIKDGNLNQRRNTINYLFRSGPNVLASGKKLSLIHMSHYTWLNSKQKKIFKCKNWKNRSSKRKHGTISSQFVQQAKPF